MLANVLPLVVMRCLILPLLAGLCIGFGHLIAGSTLRRTGRGLADRLLIGGLVGMGAISWMGTILAALGVFKWWLFADLLLGLAACCAVLPVWSGGARGAGA
jgi:hypothetical protein